MISLSLIFPLDGYSLLVMFYHHLVFDRCGIWSFWKRHTHRHSMFHYDSLEYTHSFFSVWIFHFRRRSRSSLFLLQTWRRTSRIHRCSYTWQLQSVTCQGYLLIFSGVLVYCCHFFSIFDEFSRNAEIFCSRSVEIWEYFEFPEIWYQISGIWNLNIWPANLKCEPSSADLEQLTWTWPDWGANYRGRQEAAMAPAPPAAQLAP